jgi:hypothetical protein
MWLPSSTSVQDYPPTIEFVHLTIFCQNDSIEIGKQHAKAIR